MPDKMLIYSKNMGEQPVPLTVRIEWLPNGTIKPLMYWTPNECCYEVKHIYECIQLAHLKDRAIGLRFKVKAVAIETPESYTNTKNAQHETYLYFADNWFCGKNIIDGRYGHASKEYITVALDVFPDCNYELLYFWVGNNRYMVEKTLAVEPRGSFSAGGVGIWHKVETRLVNAEDEEDPNPLKSVRRRAALFFEINKWFVSVRQ